MTTGDTTPELDTDDDLITKSPNKRDVLWRLYKDGAITDADRIALRNHSDFVILSLAKHWQSVGRGSSSLSSFKSFKDETVKEAKFMPVYGSNDSRFSDSGGSGAFKTFMLVSVGVLFVGGLAYINRSPSAASEPQASAVKAEAAEAVHPEAAADAASVEGKITGDVDDPLNTSFPKVKAAGRCAIMNSVILFSGCGAQLSDDLGDATYKLASLAIGTAAKGEDSFQGCPVYDPNDLEGSEIMERARRFYQTLPTSYPASKIAASCKYAVNHFLESDMSGRFFYWASTVKDTNQAAGPNLKSQGPGRDRCGFRPDGNNIALGPDCMPLPLDENGMAIIPDDPD